MISKQPEKKGNGAGRPKGWGADARDEMRPGVPMRARPALAEGAHPTHLQQTEGARRVTKSKQLKHLTPVFGTRQPPKFLSGALRRLAYRQPQHKSRHWFLLIAADRIDVLEHRSGKLAVRLLAGGAGGFGVLLVAAAVRKRWLAKGPEYARRDFMRYVGRYFSPRLA